MKSTLKQALLTVLGISSLGFVAPAALSQMPQVGLGFEGFGLNQAQTTITEFVGDCSGEDVGELKAHFVSSISPPAEGRRVVIRNVTEGVNSSKVPYSDREYDSGRGSQGIKMVPGAKHKKTAFVFIPNKVNTFEFDIMQDQKVIEQGLFDAVISVNTQTVQRSINWVTETFCIDTGDTDMNGCLNPGIRERGSCPGEYSYRYRNIRSLNNPNHNSGPVIIIQ